MNKRMKKKINDKRVYGLKKIKKYSHRKLYVKPELWPKRVWVFADGFIGDDFRMRHIGMWKDEAEDLLDSAYECDSEFQWGYAITDYNLRMLAVVGNYDVDITIDPIKKLGYIESSYGERTVNLLNKRAIDGIDDSIGLPLCVYEYLKKTIVLHYDDFPKNADVEFFRGEHGEFQYVERNDLLSFETGNDFFITSEEYNALMEKFGKKFVPRKEIYEPKKDTESIYGVYEIFYGYYKEFGIPYMEDILGMRDEELTWAEESDVICIYYYANSKEEAMEEYKKLVREIVEKLLK